MPPREACWAWETLASCLDRRPDESSSEYRPSTTGIITVKVTSVSMRVKPRSLFRPPLPRIAEPHEDGLLGLAQAGERAGRRPDGDRDFLDRVRGGRHDSRREIVGVLLDRVGPLERVAIPRRPRGGCRRRSGARRRVVPLRQVVVATGVGADNAAAPGGREARWPSGVLPRGDGEPRVGGRIADQLFELLPGERVGAPELIGGGSRLDRPREEGRDREQAEGE